MNPFLPALLALATLSVAVVPSQSPAERLAASSLSFDPTTLRYDQPATGTLWAANAHYKLGFEHAGSRFVPFLSSSASRSWSFAQRLVEVRVGETALHHRADGDEVAMLRDADVVDLRHSADLVERWHLRAEGAEQTFVVQALPSRDGPLVVTLDVDTDFEVAPAVDGGFLLESPDGAARISAAVAYDAAGRRCAVEGRWLDGRLEYTVPPDFVATARLPLVIDPVLRQQVLSQVTYLVQADVAYVADRELTAVVAFRPYSAVDGDVFAAFLDAAGVVQVWLWIDVSTADWKEPRVAAVRNPAQFLCIASVLDPTSGKHFIRGRYIDYPSSYVLQPPFDIAGVSATDKRLPDVGGDSSGLGIARFCTVWEETTSTGDRDVYYRFLDRAGNGGVRAPLAASAAYDDHRPRISATRETHYPGDLGEWLVVFERTLHAADTDIYAQRVRFDGALVGSPIAVATTAAVESYPAVSSPTGDIDGHRYHLVVYQRDARGNGDWDIHAKLLEHGAVLREIDVSGLEPFFATREQIRPTVAATEARFLVGWNELYITGGGDYDVFLMSLHLTGSGASLQLGAAEARQPIALRPTPELDPQIASFWEGGADGAPDAVVVDSFEVNSSTHALDVTWLRGSYGSDSTVVTLPHGCGFPITYQGEAWLGSRMTIQVPGTGGTFATSGLLLGLSRAQPIPLCGSCLLGVDGDAYPSTVYLDLPTEGSLLGATIGAQGYDLVGGSCFGRIRVSDTLEITLR